MFDELYSVGEIGLIALFGVLTVACLVIAPKIGQILGWTVPDPNRADYIIRAQATIITVIGMVLAFSLVQTHGNLRQDRGIGRKRGVGT